MRFIAILLVSAIFVSDLLFPEFNTGGILYQSLFILSLWIPSRHNNLLLATLCSFFIGFGYWWHHGFEIHSFDLFTRSLSLAGIWSIGIVGLRKEKWFSEVSDKERRIKNLIEQRTQDDRESFRKKNQALNLKLRQIEIEASDLQELEETHRKEKEAAEAVSRVKSDFLDSMGHEIQGPLAGVLDIASLLSETALDREQRDYVYTIRSTSESLLSITKDILDFSYLDAGQVKSNNRPFVLRTCVESAFDMVVHRIVQKDVELSYNLDPAIPVTINSDSSLIKQVLVNLLENAVKFTQTGEIIVSSKLLEKNSDGLLVYFSVQDTGVGISAEKLDNLFNKNDQDVPASDDDHRSGLGLSICTRLCEILGGKIWAESEEGKGSVFQFVIPVQKAAKQDIPLQGKPWFIGKHALVVARQAGVQRFLNHQLKNWGMQATVLSSGADAIRWYTAGNLIDIALIDLDLPVLDGLTLAHQIRQNDEHMPIILMTALGERVSDPALSTTLTKPIKQQSLYDRLNSILSLSSSIVEEYSNLRKS